MSKALIKEALELCDEDELAVRKASKKDSKRIITNSKKQRYTKNSKINIFICFISNVK